MLIGSFSVAALNVHFCRFYYLFVIILTRPISQAFYYVSISNNDILLYTFIKVMNVILISSVIIFNDLLRIFA